MDPIKENHDIDRATEMAPDHLHPLDFSGEDPSIFPRIGDEYQVQLPPLKMEMDCLQSTQRSIIAAGVPEVDHAVEIGLAIPVFWVPAHGNCTREELEEISYNREGTDKVVLAGLEKSRKSQNSRSSTDELRAAENLSCEIPKCAVSDIEQGAEVLNETSDGKPYARLKSLDSAPSDVHVDMKSQNVQRRRPKCYSAVPGSQSTSWSDAEIEYFILGLYIFGKNLVHVRNFIASKKMGDVLSFYYGTFYKSSAHRRWSECRKSKNKRCIHGQRIFSGWRQQELLSRLLPGLSPDKQNALLKVTKTFNDGETSLEDYVVTLKGIVGIQALAEAVGIGKVKHDLTGVALDHVKGNQALSINSEIPAGKACSALTSGEIIKFLTGNFRLSKTRSNDLFWEAVWPRLLAKGWHSEQPKDHIGAASKNNLVFLIPGVKKFSRSKLVKGEHYFDSVSDVLNKVASDPMLLVLEVEGDKGNSGIKEEDGCADVALDQKGPPNNNQPCYLRPSFPNFTSDLMKFTVVDTSLVQGEEPYKIREIRSLPPDNTRNYIPSSSSDGTEFNGSSEHLDSGDASLPEQEESDLGTSDSKNPRNNLKRTMDQKMQSDHPLPIPKKKRIHKQDANGQGTDTLSEQTAKNINSHSKKFGKLNYLSPVTKRHKITACNFLRTGQRAPSFPRGHHLKKETSCQSKSPDAIDTLEVKLGTDSGSGKGSCLGNYADTGHGDPSFPRQCRLKKEKSSQLESLHAVDTVGVKLGIDSGSGNGSSQGKTSTSFLGEGGSPGKTSNCSPGKGSPNESGSRIFSGSSVGPASVNVMASSVEKSQHRGLIDLNIPQFPPDFDATVPFSAETTESQDATHMNGTSQSETQQHLDGSRPVETSNMVPSDQQHGMNERRQSTRSRPPTTKALEALASGYFNTRRRGRSSKTPSRSSRSVRKNVKASSSFVSISNSNIASEITYSRAMPVDEENSYYENGRNFFSRLPAEPESKQLTCDFLRIS